MTYSTTLCGGPILQTRKLRLIEVLEPAYNCSSASSRTRVRILLTHDAMLSDVSKPKPLPPLLVSRMLERGSTEGDGLAGKAAAGV